MAFIGTAEEEDVGGRGLREIKAGEVGFREAAAIRASGITAGVRREILEGGARRLPLEPAEEGVTGEGADDCGCSSITSTGGLMRP